jgi:alginate O-acetyltransferase complex protein AlgI
MLFNSPFFLFVFFPITITIFFLCGRISIAFAQAWLAIASLFFYAWWNPPYLLLLLFSAVINYTIGQSLQRQTSLEHRQIPRKTLLWAGLAFNLIALAYFKYFIFLLSILSGLTGRHFSWDSIVLPLGISFFTFQKIAYLVDSYIGKVREKSFLNYILFVSFFPQLIAGPIVHYSEVFPQFKNQRTYHPSVENIADGLSIFLLGLAKKVVLADEYARYANAGFDAASQGVEVSLVAAWLAAVAYTLQLYFDFSGYSDMAVGLARTFNIELPLNFNSPYKATSIIDFWRRWHMTLSRFLRDYLYIPLGGNRRGRVLRYCNLLLTMTIGGLWHGAAWTFVAWGALHGVYLLINHFWRSLEIQAKWKLLGRVGAHVLTITAVIIGWVLFRANNLSSATHIYRGMLGLNGAVLPTQITALFPLLQRLFGSVAHVAGLSDSTVMGTIVSLTMVGAGAVVVLVAPNIYEMSVRQRYFMILISFALSLQKILFSSDISPFLYFQF